MFVETREIPTNTNYRRYNHNRYNEISEEDEDYPQNNICYECGKQLKWEHMCPDCGVSNREEEEKETTATNNHSDYNDMEERLDSLAEEIRKWKDKSRKERQSAIDDVETLDGDIENVKKNVTTIEKQISQVSEWKEEIEFMNEEMNELALSVHNIKKQITQIKNSDVNNGTEFYRLKKEVVDQFNDQKEIVEKEFSIITGNVKKTALNVIKLINQHNEDLPVFTGMKKDIQEILKWKKELEKEK